MYTNVSTSYLIYHLVGEDSSSFKGMENGYAQIPFRTNPRPPLRVGTVTTSYDVTVLVTGEIE